MSIAQKLKHEIKAVLVTTLFFGAWIGGLLMIKALVLAEYQIAFRHYSMALIGALILAKVVLVLEHVSLGAWVRSQPAWVDVLLRTLLYSLGVFLVLVIEGGFEGRLEHGGFLGAVAAAFRSADIHHVYANLICVAGALFLYNVLAVFRVNLGADALLRMLARPVPTSPSPEGQSEIDN